MGGALYSLLKPLGLYRLEQDSLIWCELQAYEAAFEVLEELLSEIRGQSFVQTATGQGLVRHEKLVGLQERGGVSLENRRELVLYRLSTSPFDFTPDGMVSSVRAAGMDAVIIQNYDHESLTIISKRLIDDFLDLDAVKASLSTMLPAHLGAEYDIGVMTWDMFHEWDGTWDEWDEMDFTWSHFDLDGHNLFDIQNFGGGEAYAQQ